jgi:hypothetical protein
MLVKASTKTNNVKTIVNGIAILNDLERNIYAINPAIKQAIAVRVPEGNIAQAHAEPIIKKNIRCFFILLVIPKIINATAVDAIPIPKLAASLKIEK